MYPIPYNYQNIYQKGYLQTPYNYSQAGVTYPNYGFQTVYLPNFDNIFFYNWFFLKSNLPDFLFLFFGE